LKHPITSQISLLIEPMYIGKGSVTVNPQLKSRTSVGLNYLEMPLMLKLSTDSVPQGLFLTGGLMYGYLLHGTQKNYLDGRLTSSSNYSYTDKTNRAQWSAGIGIGHEMGSWMWELRGQSSLNTFDRLQRSHNVVYSIQLCWRFPSTDEKARKKAGKGGHGIAGKYRSNQSLIPIIEEAGNKQFHQRVALISDLAIGWSK
jgi:hypothetical protein